QAEDGIRYRNVTGVQTCALPIFNINEPVIFGMPILYNPIMAIPFIIAPMITATITYVTINIGLVDPIIAQNPWPAPVGLGAFIATAGDWRSILLALVNVLVAFVIYYPFVKMYDKRLVEEELENTNE